jgi:cellobiose-specific phosphotransferase system component IIA
MKKMNWIPSSKGTALVVLLVCSLAVAGTAGAISVSESDAPDDAETGQQVETTVVINDPFVEMNNEWTLEGATELVDDSATWTVTITDQGDEINQTVYEGQNFSQVLRADNEGDRLEIELSGEAPSPEGSYSYDPPQAFTLYDLDSVSGNSRSDLANGTKEIHHYTNESRTARQAIDDARETINETGANGEAESQLNNAISSYNNGNFGNAEDLAGQASDEAEQAQQSEETQQTILYGVAAIVVLALIGGGIYYYRSQQDDYGKLQ